MNRENDVDIYLSIFAQDIFLSIINNKYYIENDNLLRKRIYIQIYENNEKLEYIYRIQ